VCGLVETGVGPHSAHVELYCWLAGPPPGVQEVFALKFGKPQDAEEFKKAFDEAKTAMKKFFAVGRPPSATACL
jgi:hypothetical protein